MVEVSENFRRKKARNREEIFFIFVCRVSERLLTDIRRRDVLDKLREEKKVSGTYKASERYGRDDRSMEGFM